jgi:hypothetical protein
LIYSINRIGIEDVVNDNQVYLDISNDEKEEFFAKMRKQKIYTMEAWYNFVEPLDSSMKKEYTNNNARLMGFFASRYKKQKKDGPLTSKQLLAMFNITDKDIHDYRERLKKKYIESYQQRERGRAPDNDKFDVGEYMQFQNRKDSLRSIMSGVRSVFEKHLANDHKVNDWRVFGKCFLVCGAAGTGKTSFVDHFHNTWQKQEDYYLSDEKKDFYAAIDRSKYLLRLGMNFKNDPYQREENMVTCRILYQILKEMNKEGGAYSTFVSKYGSDLKNVFLVDVLRMVHPDDEELVFMLHLDETQQLFGEVSENEKRRHLSKNEGVSADVRKISPFYHILEQVRINIARSNSKYTIIPIMTGTNALALHKAYENSGIPFTTVSLELLKRKHFVKIIRGLLDDTKMVLPSAFLDVMDLFAGHPRCFEYFLIHLSNYQNSIANTATPTTVPDDVFAKGSRERYSFTMKGFRSAIKHIESTTDKATICWVALQSVGGDLKGQLFPSMQNFTSAMQGYAGWCYVKDKVLSYALEMKVVSRDMYIDRYQIGDLENIGFIFLDPVNNPITPDTFIVKMPFIIMDYMQQAPMRSLPEPILAMNSVLTAEDNELQDLCTFVNRVYAHKNPGDDTVDLYDVMPTLFKKGELEVILEDKVFMRNSMFPCTSISQLRNKLQFGIAYLNVEKTSWADSFIKFRVNDRAGTGIKILYLLIQSKRHAVDSREKDRIDDEKYFKDLANDVQNNLKSGEAVRYLYISDASVVPPTSEDEEIETTGVEHNEEGEDELADEEVEAEDESQKLLQDFKWAIIIDGSKRMEYDGKYRYALRHLRNRLHYNEKSKDWIFVGLHAFVQVQHGRKYVNLLKRGAATVHTRRCPSLTHLFVKRGTQVNKTDFDKLTVLDVEWIVQSSRASRKLDETDFLILPA